MIAQFARPIPYYKAFRKVCGSTSSTVLLTQLEYWFDVAQTEMGKDHFYKFIEPPTGENTYGYKVGDSWCEELGWDAKEFRQAFSEIGIAYKSKKAFDKAIKKNDPLAVFKKTFTTQKRSIKKGSPSSVEEIQEEGLAMFASYHDRLRRRTYFFRNDRFMENLFNIVASKQPTLLQGQLDYELSHSTRTAKMAVTVNAKMAVPLSGEYLQESIKVKDNSFFGKKAVAKDHQDFSPKGNQEECEELGELFAEPKPAILSLGEKNPTTQAHSNVKQSPVVAKRLANGDMIQFFRDEWERRFGEEHNRLTGKQLRYVDAVFTEYEVGADMIQAYFNEEFQEDCDYRILHFCNDSIINNFYMRLRL